MFAGVILSEAKNLSGKWEILRYAQDDIGRVSTKPFALAAPGG